MRVLIVDDEIPARTRLRHLLAAEPDIEIAGECSDGDSALRTAESVRPDLIFLDIAMPGRDGLTVAQKLANRVPTRIVFTTAHAEPAVEAFELDAIDYLLKPFSRTRFAAALDRARRMIAPQPADPAATSVGTAPPYPAGPDTIASTPDRLLVKSGSRYRVIDTDDILSVQAAANYVVLHTREGKHIMRSTLKQIADDLCPRRFFRTSRSTIANLQAVREIKPNASGSHVVVLSDGTDLPLTSGLRELEARLRQLA